MSTLSTIDKILTAIDVVALGTVAGMLLYNTKKLDIEPSVEKGDKKTPKKDEKGTTSSVVDDPAMVLREAGNKAYREGKLAEAVSLYSESIELNPPDSHVLFSNRSVANLQMGFYKEALHDAIECTKRAPNWSKGYFRVGKAYSELGNSDEAYLNYYKCLMLEDSEHIKKIAEMEAQKLGLSDLDTRNRTESLVMKAHFKKLNEDAREQLGLGLSSERGLMQILEEAKAQIGDPDSSTTPSQKQEMIGKFTSLVEELLSDAISSNGLAVSKAIAAALFWDLEMPEHAIHFVTKAYGLSPEDPEVLLLRCHIILGSDGVIPDVQEILTQLRFALSKSPDIKTPGVAVVIAHTLAIVLLKCLMTQQQLWSVEETFAILKDMVPSLYVDNVNKLLMTDAGLRLWFKQLADPEIQQKFQAENQQMSSSGLTEEQSILESLKSGTWRSLCTDPFFVTVMSEVPFLNPTVEKAVLVQYRRVLAEASHEDLESVQDFAYSLALQCYRGGYILESTDAENTLVDKIKRQVVSALDKEDGGTPLVVDGQFSDPKFAHNLFVLSLYEPLDEVEERLDQIAAALDLSKLHKYFAKMITKSILEPAAEIAFLDSGSLPIVSTNHPDSCPDIEFYDSYVIPPWDYLQFPSYFPRTFAREMTWRLPEKYSDEIRSLFPDDQKIRILVAGCGGGQDAAQLANIYSNAEILAVDCSSTNLAYAHRQSQEFGFTNLQFVQGDICSLDPTKLGGKPFDFIVALNVFHHHKDPLAAWSALVKLLKPGGLMECSLYSSHFIQLLNQTRQLLNEKMSPPCFNKNKKLPRLIRTPTNQELRDARQFLFDYVQKSKELAPLFHLQQAYQLNLFRDMIFHPSVLGFNYSTIGKCLEEVGMNLVSFEFPAISQQTVLEYNAEFPEDPFLQNPANLDAFDKKQEGGIVPIAISPSLTFLSQKPRTKE